MSKERQITIRVDASMLERVDALRCRLVAIEQFELSRTALLRRLMADGLAAFEARLGG